MDNGRLTESDKASEVYGIFGELFLTETYEEHSLRALAAGYGPAGPGVWEAIRALLKADAARKGGKKA